MKNIEEIRKILNVPKEQRIAQFIYNKFRDHEQSLAVLVREKDKMYEKDALGIDIFYVEDSEFAKRFADEKTPE